MQSSADDVLGEQTNDLAVTSRATSEGSADGPSPLAFLNNVAPLVADPEGSAAPNATFQPTGATPTQVRQALGDVGLSETGAGVKVGVLSDSFNNLGGAAADEADGALPATVQVLEDLGSKGTDEGRAMLQIVHDVAPGASLAFYTASKTEQDFADGIEALAAAGCKVICDDESYFDEPFFQSGVISQAIKTVEAEGVIYLTAAGNDASNASQSAWNPIASTSFDGTTLTDTESFGGFGGSFGETPVQTITLGAGDPSLPLLLEWNQPYGATTSDLEVLVFQNGSLLGTVTNSDSGEPTNPWIDVNLPGAGTYQIAVENLSGPNPGLIKEVAEGDGYPFTISGTNTGSSYGHPTTSGDITVGAADSGNTPAFGVGAPQAESFSSSGAGSELLFNPDGTSFSLAPDPTSGASVTGIDDIKTTVSGNLSDFFGTSAATPSVAGVVALMLQANPDLTEAQIEHILQESAIPMADASVSGAGLVQANLAVADALAPQPTNAAIAQTSNGALDYLEFTGANLSASDLVSYTSWDIRAEGDFNNDDGLSTQLVAQDPSNANSGAIDLLLVHDGTLVGSDLEQGTYWKVVGAGDFDGSGRTGIATQNTTTGQIDLLWFTGAQLTGSELLNGDYQPVVGAADFNGDGKTDLVTQSSSGGPLDFLFFNGANLSGSFETSSSFWPVHDVADSGAAGQSLMLSQNATTGQLDYLNFNGTTLAATALESGGYPGLTPVQGTQLATQLYSI